MAKRWQRCGGKDVIWSRFHCNVAESSRIRLQSIKIAMRKQNVISINSIVTMKKGNRIETILGNYRGQLLDKHLEKKDFTTSMFVNLQKCCKLIFFTFFICFYVFYFLTLEWGLNYAKHSIIP